jgi:hypothetical protein
VLDEFLGRHSDMRTAFAALKDAQDRGQDLYESIAAPDPPKP